MELELWNLHNNNYKGHVGADKVIGEGRFVAAEKNVVRTSQNLL